MKVVRGLCLLLLAACFEARSQDLRPEVNSRRCPTVDPLLYTVHLPHPTDCNMFLRCDHGTAKPERCPAHLHFNPVRQVCDWPVNAGCVKVHTTAPGGNSEWNVDVEPQADDPREDLSMPIQEVVSEKEVPREYIPETWVDSGDVQSEAVDNAGVENGDTHSEDDVDDADIFDADIEYAT